MGTTEKQSYLDTRCLKLIGIFLFCFFPSQAYSKTFEIKRGYLEFCHPYTQEGQIVRFQGPLHTKQDYEKNLVKSTARNDLSGVSIDFGRSKKFNNIDKLFSYVNQETFIKGRNVRVLGSELGVPTDLIFRLCVIYENKEGERVYANNWNKWIVGRIIYNAARIIQGSDHENTNISFNNRVVTERVVKPDGKDGRLFVTYEAGAPGEFISRIYSIKGAVRDMKKVLANSDIKIEINYQPEISVKDVGIYKYYSPKPGVEPYESNVLIDQSDLIEVTMRSNATKETKDLWKFSGDAVWKAKRLAQSWYIFTNHRLSLNFLDYKMFGDNPKGGMLLICELRYSKGSSKCDEYRL